MTTINLPNLKFRKLFRWLRFKLVKMLDWLESTMRLCQAVHRSGLKRTLWIIGYIENTLGGYYSYKNKLPVDKQKCPWPWYTYPAIEFLRQYDFSNCEIFEFGSGNSSRFWSKHALTITSVEIDPNWYAKGVQDLSSNQKLYLREKMEGYLSAIHFGENFYDVIVIDGLFRYNCVFEALKRLKSGGIIVLDNSDWFPNSAKLLRDNGFVQVDFVGAGPINSYAWCTSIFFKEKIDIPRIQKNQLIEVLGGRSQLAAHDRYIN